MTTSQVYRNSGLASLVGAITFAAHIVLRSVITAGLDPSASAQQDLWVPINMLGVLGAVLVLLGLPAIYVRGAEKTGLAGFIGTALIALTWMFFGLFLSLYAVLILPWLADRAPALVAASAPIPAAFLIAFIVGLAASITGAVLLAVPFIRGRVHSIDSCFAGSCTRFGNVLLCFQHGPERSKPNWSQPNSEPMLQSPREGLLPVVGYAGALQ